MTQDERAEMMGAAVAEIVDRRRYGLYDYSGYPGDAPPHVVRDEISGASVFRAECRNVALSEYERLCRRYIGESVLALIEAHKCAKSASDTTDTDLQGADHNALD